MSERPDPPTRFRLSQVCRSTRPGIAEIDLPEGRFLAWTEGKPFKPVAVSAPLFVRLTSTIYEIDRETLLKVCHAHSFPKLLVWRMLGRSRAQVEASSNRRIHALGLSTPEVIATGSILNPFSRLDSALIVQRVPESRVAVAFLNDNDVPMATRMEFLERMVEGLQTMHRAGVVLRDFRLNNILVSGRDITPIWIDNDLKRVITQAQIARKLHSTLRRVLTKDAPRIPEPLARQLRSELANMAESQGCNRDWTACDNGRQDA